MVRFERWWKMEMVVEGVGDEEIMGLGWRVKWGGRENEIGEIGEGFEILVGMEFSEWVGGIRGGSVGLRNG